MLTKSVSMNYLPDIPKLKTHPVPERFLIIKMITLIFLALLLYTGIAINYYLLQIQIPLWLNMFYGVGILLLITFETLFAYLQYQRITYIFYEAYLEIRAAGVEKIPYTSIRNVWYTSNVFDRYFATGTVQLTLASGRKIFLRHLAKSNEVYFFMQKQIA